MDLKRGHLSLKKTREFAVVIRKIPQPLISPPILLSVLYIYVKKYSHSQISINTNKYILT